VTLAEGLRRTKDWIQHPEEVELPLQDRQ
jgi:hypothetical protein